MFLNRRVGGINAAENSIANGFGAPAIPSWQLDSVPKTNHVESITLPVELNDLKTSLQPTEQVENSMTITEIDSIIPIDSLPKQIEPVLIKVKKDMGQVENSRIEKLLIGKATIAKENVAKVGVVGGTSYIPVARAAETSCLLAPISPKVRSVQNTGRMSFNRSIYIKNTGQITDKDFHGALKNITKIKRPPNRDIAFVEFASLSDVAKVVGRVFECENGKFKAEERRALNPDVDSMSV